MFTNRYKTHHDVEKQLSKFIKSKISSKKMFLAKLQEENTSKKLSLYLHTPYCDKICSFCNMNRKQGKKEIETYVQYLYNEIVFYGKLPFCKSSEIDVIFFGGGTPTIFSKIQLEFLLQSLYQNFKISPNCEITFETTLHNLSMEKIKILQKYKVNRISVGIQTFSERGRKLLNRTFSKEEAVQKLKCLRKSFSETLCIDILYNYPEETEEELLEDLRIANEIGVDSISFYSLITITKSKLLRYFQMNSLSQNYSLEKDQKLHKLFYEKAQSYGYQPLELTKVAKKDSYQYLRRLYQNEALLPLGIGAGGRIQNIACYHMNSRISFYLAYSNIYMQLYQILGLFQFPSISAKELQKFFGKQYPKLEEKMKDFVKEGYFTLKNEVYSYTTQGVFWGNNISVEILDFSLKNTSQNSFFMLS